MAEPSSQPHPGELPQRFADWMRSIEDAKSVLDTVLLCGPSSPSARDVGGCLNFVTCTVFGVQVGYGVLHRQSEGVVEYDLLHVHSIGMLAEQLLESLRHSAQKPSPQEELSHVLRLCRICTEVCGKILHWLAQEAMDSRSMEQTQEGEETGPQPACVACPPLREAWGMDAPEDLHLPTNPRVRPYPASIAPSVGMGDR